VHRKVTGSPNGALYVASSNFDKCFDTGAVIALDLDALELPAIGAFEDGEPVQVTDLKVGPEASVQIESFAGQMDVWNRRDGSARLFVPTRAENNNLHAIDVGASDKTALSCVPNLEARNCLVGALSLTAGVPVGTNTTAPRAPGPLGVRVSLNAEEKPEVWVTHLEAADSPEGSATNFRSFVVRVPGDGETLNLSSDNFFPLGSTGLTNGAAHATAVGTRYAYVTGRVFVANDTTQPATFLLRLVDRDDPSRVLETSLRLLYSTIEARDIAISPTRVGNTERLYIVARAPDTLLVVDVAESESLRPTVSVVDAVPLPDGANQLAVLNRGALGDLVAVTATTTGVVVLYDAALGQIVSQVDNVGLQPFGITADVDAVANQARLYVTAFGDGRVAVIDIENLAVAQNARLVAHLGARQGRDEEQGTSTCERQESEP
jgi:DNA-binding beta-propeller fold protein YncE